MKTKLYLIIFFIFAIRVADLYAENVFYVYQNDGKINAFFTYEVDSIVSSQLDLDSVWHTTYQVQEIWTSDSVYRIPLDNIDSVSFITPETVYKEGVINLSDNLMDYLIRCDSMTLYFRDNTPDKLLPIVGDKIVTVEMNDILPSGFAGEVIRVTFENNEHAVECTETALTNIFDTYYCLGATYAYAESENKVRQKKLESFVHDSGIHPIPLPAWEFSMSSMGIEVVDKKHIAVDVDRPIDKELKLSITPELYLKTFLIIENGQYYFYYNINGEFLIEEQFGFKGQISGSFKPLRVKTVIPIPNCPLINLYIEPGVYLDAELSAAIYAGASQTIKIFISDELATEKERVLKPGRKFSPINNGIEIQGAIEGSLELGGFLTFGLQFKDKNLLDLALTSKIGGRLSTSGTAILYEEDIPNLLNSTDIYDHLLETKCSFDLVGTVELEACVLKSLLGDSAVLNCSWEQSENMHSWDLVPVFNNVSFENTGQSSDATSQLSGDCLCPIKYGYSVRNEANEEIDYYYAKGETFKKGYKDFKQSFKPYKVENKYTLYPIVNWLGLDLLASPSAILKDKKWVTIKDFVVTDTIYSEKQELEYDGNNYFYKHLCDVTVELQDTTGVVDWGYVYIDPKSDSTFISLATFGTRYTDSRYAYYRNNAEDSVCLAGYATFANGEQYIGEHTVYHVTYEHYCSNNEHYHGVDLGLSSNILWACCNLGASKPEEYGNYYAYAETTTKNVYSEVNYWYFYYDYQFGGQYSYYELIGSGTIKGCDISGTAFDVVTHEWNEGWRTPTEKEIQELVDSCTWTWTTKNGIIGYKVTGPNNNSIFLPASGGKVESTNYSGEPDKLTWYRSSVWSGVQMGIKGYGYTYGIRFKKDMVSFSDMCAKAYGYVIRPVRNKETEE